MIKNLLITTKFISGEITTSPLILILEMVTMETARNILSFLGLIGVPSLGAIIGWLAKTIRTQKKAQDALKKGVQAILRSQMITNYNKWYVEKGYAPIWVKDNFENLWIQYEALGENGVMKKIHDEFVSLPTEQPTRKEI